MFALLVCRAFPAYDLQQQQLLRVNVFIVLLYDTILVLGALYLPISVRCAACEAALALRGHRCPAQQWVQNLAHGNFTPCRHVGTTGLVVLLVEGAMPLTLCCALSIMPHDCACWRPLRQWPSDN